MVSFIFIFMITFCIICHCCACLSGKMTRTWGVWTTCIILICGIVEAVVPRNLPPADSIEKVLLVEDYIRKGFKTFEIFVFLLIRHGIVTSLRTVKKILQPLGLKQQKVTYTGIIVKELQTSGQCIGYRTMWC